MSSTHEDVILRLQRLERDLEELTSAVHRRVPTAPERDFAEQHSFRAWMKISAPSFAVMLMGFTLLWNAQQAGNAQLFEMSRSLGRLDGAIASLESKTKGIDQRLVEFDERLVSLDQRLAGLDQRLELMDARLATMNTHLAALASSVARLGAAVGKLERRL